MEGMGRIQALYRREGEDRDGRPAPSPWTTAHGTKTSHLHGHGGLDLPCRLFPLVLVQVGGGEVCGLTTGAKALFCFTAETMLAGEKEKIPEELLQLEGRLVEEAMVGLDGTTRGGKTKSRQFLLRGCKQALEIQHSWVWGESGLRSKGCRTGTSPLDFKESGEIRSTVCSHHQWETPSPV